MCQGPRTVQSEETEIPSLAKERKLKTKCFFLKSRKEAASVEFFDGGWGEMANGEELPSPRAPRPGGGGYRFPCSHEPVEELVVGIQAPKMCSFHPERGLGPWRFCS